MNRLLFLSFTLFTLLISGCEHFQPRIEPQKITTQAPPKQPEEAPEPILSPFTKDSLSSLLTAEFAEHRGYFDVSLKIYVEQAQKTNDPYVTERAYQIANYLSANKELSEMALLWVKTAPENIQAQQAAAIQLAQDGQYDQANIYIEKLIARNETPNFDFLALSINRLPKESLQNVIKTLEKLPAKHSNNLKVIYTKAILFEQDGQYAPAFDLLQKIPLEEQPPTSILMQVNLLQQLEQSDKALALLQQSIELFASNKELRLTYAHLLIANGQLAEAKQQFNILSKQFPKEEDLRFALALICLENKEWDEAIFYLQQIIANDIRLDAVYYYLGIAYEEKGEKELALNSYQQVQTGSNFLAAQARSVKILIDKESINVAQQLLSNARTARPEHRIPLYLLEIEALSNAQQLTSAQRLVNQALKETPQDISLLYSRALVAEKLNNLKQTEKDLRTIIRKEPQNTTALNALGYILADRTTRYKEALALIQQAYKINPDDPAILDSLGWINFRLGNLSEALTYTQQAYERYPDPEVASHLGEILWAQGKKEQAKTIWLQALKDSPDNQTLKSTILRLTGNKEL